MLFAKEDIFIPSFPICRPVFFFCLIALAWTSSTMLKGVEIFLSCFWSWWESFLFPPLSVILTLKWRRQWDPTPVLLPGKSHGRRSLVGCSPWGHFRVGHDWASSLSLFTFMHWRRKWQSTPVFLPGKSQGWGSLVGCCLWGRTESDTTEVT